MYERWGWKWYLRRNVIQIGINPKITIRFGYDIASLMHWIKILAICVTILSYICGEGELPKFFQLKVIFKFFQRIVSQIHIVAFNLSNNLLYHFYMQVRAHKTAEPKSCLGATGTWCSADQEYFSFGCIRFTLNKAEEENWFKSEIQII